jgi:hypothetical protein
MSAPNEGTFRRRPPKKCLMPCPAGAHVRGTILPNICVVCGAQLPAIAETRGDGKSGL